jgi:hypothetical protein
MDFSEVLAVKLSEISVDLMVSVACVGPRPDRDRIVSRHKLYVHRFPDEARVVQGLRIEEDWSSKTHLPSLSTAIGENPVVIVYEPALAIDKCVPDDRFSLIFPRFFGQSVRLC